MEVQEILKKVRKIEIKTKNISKHLFSGDYNSAFKGRGMSFSEVREYSYGDDVRHIDWNVTARTNFPHIKVFEEEREMTMMFLIDCSRSALWGTSDLMKNEYITEICAVLAFSAINNNDKVGAILFTDQIEHYISPKKGRKQILRILREIVNLDQSKGKTDLSGALKYFHSLTKKKTTCFLISDFLDESYENAMKIVSRKHDLIAIQVYDKAEKELPNVGLIQVVDQETGENRLIDTSDRGEQKRYKQRFETAQSKLLEICRQAKVGLMNLKTDEDYVKELMGFFKRRKK